MHCSGLGDASFRPYRRIVSTRAMLIFCVNDEGIHVKKSPAPERARLLSFECDGLSLFYQNLADCTIGQAYDVDAATGLSESSAVQVKHFGLSAIFVGHEFFD